MGGKNILCKRRVPFVWHGTHIQNTYSVLKAEKEISIMNPPMTRYPDIGLKVKNVN